MRRGKWNDCFPAGIGDNRRITSLRWFAMHNHLFALYINHPEFRDSSASIQWTFTIRS